MQRKGIIKGKEGKENEKKGIYFYGSYLNRIGIAVRCQAFYHLPRSGLDDVMWMLGVVQRVCEYNIVYFKDIIVWCYQQYQYPTADNNNAKKRPGSNFSMASGLI